MSDTRFTASNGWYVDENRLYTELRGLWGLLDRQEALALAEYGAHQAQAARDAELGRWRSVEHPDWVVYSQGDDGVRLFDERGSNSSYSILRDHIYPSGATKVCYIVAAEYWAAHPVPEPKPWLDAQPGEVWLLTVNGDDSRIVTLIGFEFRDFHGDYIVSRSDSITAGRRIWPEVTA